MAKSFAFIKSDNCLKKGSARYNKNMGSWIFAIIAALSLTGKAQSHVFSPESLYQRAATLPPSATMQDVPSGRFYADKECLLKLATLDTLQAIYHEGLEKILTHRPHMSISEPNLYFPCMKDFGLEDVELRIRKEELYARDGKPDYRGVCLQLGPEQGIECIQPSIAFYAWKREDLFLLFTFARLPERTIKEDRQVHRVFCWMIRKDEQGKYWVQGYGSSSKFSLVGYLNRESDGVTKITDRRGDLIDGRIYYAILNCLNDGQVPKG